jgi:hypothetical protein
VGIDFKKIIGAVAPTIATVLGGPLAGTAVAALSKKLLGKDGGSEAEIAEALASASPEMLLELKKLDAEFKLEMEKLEIELEKLSTQDRASARARQVAMKDWTPNILAGVALAGYAVIQFVVLTEPLVPENKEIILRTLGTLDMVVVTIIAYFFGSSRGSKAKTDLLNGKG